MSNNITTQERKIEMRLIDADILIENYWNAGCSQVVSVDDILDAPTIDAVEVVRCADCKYYGNEDRHPCGGDCAFHGSLVDRCDFCSYGERKEST